jgi:leucyl aminopeptidase (aminopeptidase T)
MNPAMERVCKRVVEECTAIVPGETCLILSDSDPSDLSTGLREAAARAGGTAFVLRLTKDTYATGSVPRVIEELLKGVDVVFLCTEGLFPHASRRAAVAAGSRVLSLGKVTVDMALRALDVDYGNLSQVTQNTAAQLRTASEVVITTEAGTALRVETANQPVTYFDGLARSSGCASVLPAGVVATLPIPGTGQGKVVLDTSISTLGLLQEPVTLTVLNGMVVDIAGKREARQLQELLDSSDENAHCLAEVGLGTNPRATYIGRMVEDERVRGSAHIGLGGNTQLGGTVRSRVHIDAAIRCPSVYFDGQAVVQGGRLLLD